MNKKANKGQIIFQVIIPIVIIVIAIFAAAIPISTAFQEKNIVQTTIINNNGSNIVGYSLSDLKELAYFTYVNHFPNQYIDPTIAGENGLIEPINDLTLATSGTLQFIIFNHDKNSNNFLELLEDKTFYSATTESNLISMYIPFAYDSASIWIDGNYYTSNGPVSKDYNPLDYAKDPNSIAIDFQNQKPTRIVCPFEVDPDKISDNRIEAAKIVTIHYQAKRGANFKNNVPVFGNPSVVLHSTTVKYTSSVVNIIIITFLLLSAFTSVIMKTYIRKLPYIGIVICALMVDIAQYIALRSSVISAKFIVLIALALILIFALFSLKPYKTKVLFPCWIASVSIACVNLFVTIIIANIASFRVIELYTQIAFTLIISICHIFGILALKQHSMIEMSGISVALAAPILSIFFSYTVLWMNNPACLLLNVSSLVLVCNVIESVVVLETKNKHLTNNLMAEVATQTHTLHHALEDRELLLSFLSHDLRKASLSIQSLSNEIINDSTNDTLKTAQRINDKNEFILTSLSDISKYMKQNFTTESFTVVTINDLFNELYRQLGMDCEAYGITLSYNTTSYSIRTKQEALISILSNLIFNAIEHAECKNITLKAYAKNNKICIAVHDDGIGISDKKDIFSPFVTTNDNDSNQGLGLFLVKSEIEALGGSISYEYNEGSTFILSLLREY